MMQRHVVDRGVNQDDWRPFVKLSNADKPSRSELPGSRSEKAMTKAGQLEACPNTFERSMTAI